MKCRCEVCEALSGLDVRHLRLPEEIAKQLPRAVQEVLAAQGRLLHRRPRPGDEELVRQAAERCRAGRFESPSPIH